MATRTTGILAGCAGLLWLVLLALSLSFQGAPAVLLAVEAILVATVVTLLYQRYRAAVGFLGWIGAFLAGAGLLALGIAVADLLVQTGVGGGALALGLTSVWVGALFLRARRVPRRAFSASDGRDARWRMVTRLHP